MTMAFVWYPVNGLLVFIFFYYWITRSGDLLESVLPLYSIMATICV